MNDLVQILADDSGYAKDDPHVWHLVDPGNEMGPAAFCTQEFFGDGESACEFRTKSTKRGGITCPSCLARLRVYKAVRVG